MMIRWFGPLCLLALLACGCSSSPPRERVSSQPMAMDHAVAAGNVRVTIDRFEIQEQDRQTFELIVHYTDRHAAVGGGPRSLYAVPGKRGIIAAIEASQSSRSSRTRQQQFLVMAAQPGTQASLEILRIVNQPWIVLIPVYDGQVLLRTEQQQVLGSGLFVTLGRMSHEQIELELTPYFNRAQDGRAVAVTHLSTRVMAAPGQPMVIMAHESQRSSMVQQLFSRRDDMRQSQQVVVLTVETASNPRGNPPAGSFD